MKICGMLFLGVGLFLLAGCGDSGDRTVKLKTREGELHEFPDRGLALHTPPNFVASDKFVGLEDPNKKVALSLERVPVPFAKMVQNFIPAAMETVDQAVVQHQPMSVEGCTGFLIETELRNERKPEHQWTLAFGDEAQTYRIDARVPFEVVEEMRPVILGCLESVKTIPYVPALPYKIEPIDGLVELKPPLTSGATMLTVNGDASDLLAASPRFMVFPRSDRRPVEAMLTEFATSKIEAYADVSPDEIASTRPIEIAGLEGIELKADGLAKDGSEPVAVYFVLLADPEGGYETLVGICPEASKEEWFPRFEQAVHSYRKT